MFPKKFIVEFQSLRLIRAISLGDEEQNKIKIKENIKILPIVKWGYAVFGV